MNADKQCDSRHEDAEVFPFKEETHAVIGCAFAVINELGHGLNEKCYENALVIEFQSKKITAEQQRPFDVLYRGVSVGRFIPDLIVGEKIIVDTKTIERITDHERGQMMNYLRITRMPLGLILNFKHSRLEWDRVIRTNS